MAKRRVAILGSTGSVGKNALRLLEERLDRFDIALLAARASVAELAAQCSVFRPEEACLAEPPDGRFELPAPTRLRIGEEGLIEALESCEPDVVLNAITGAAGLAASEWTLRNGLVLALANKESLVMAGDHLTRLAARTGATILPVDSEHCAIHQCLRGEKRSDVRRVFLTASGGPFRNRPLETFASVTPQEALRHPTWNMGPRITVGSATMMNKAFEILEAHWLFGFSAEQIEVLIHPESIVHSIVEFVDGSMLAQTGLPDMRVPILYCLGWPERLPFDFSPFDYLRWRSLTFEPVDPRRFPAVPLAYDVLRLGGDSGAVMNGADEEMTRLFLMRTAPFPAITSVVGQVVRARSPRPAAALADVLAADREGRAAAARLCENHR
ncbi:MAG: 1-deoxy-D-xylulose-5-phosphate reductoisomerase [Planctomycetota bacterium]